MGCGCSKPRKKKTRKSDFSFEDLGVVGNALRELLETEQSYGADMQYLVEKFLDPLRSEQLFFDNTDLIVYNSVVLELVPVQVEFQQKLEKAMSNIGLLNGNLADTTCHVSDLFVEFEKSFSNYYGRYITVLNKVQKVISKSTGDPKIVAYLDLKFAKYQGPDAPLNARFNTMQSLVMKPFQRVMLYPLILERIEVKCQEGCEDKTKIIGAIESVRRVGAVLNDRAREDEVQYKMMMDELGILEYEYKQHHK